MRSFERFVMAVFQIFYQKAGLKAWLKGESYRDMVVGIYI